MPRLVAAATALVGLVTLPGCSSSPSVDVISGNRVATMAEEQLEAMHPGLATGTMTCPTLDFTVDASVRCVRVAELSGGRQIRVLGTVTVTSTRDGGRLHVRLDDRVSEFGVASDFLESQLRARAQRVLGVAPDTVSCPYLAGPRGTHVTCTVTVRHLMLATGITVTGVDEQQYLTRFRWRDPLFNLRDNPGLPSLLRALRSGGVGP